jgi:dTDP-4-dehydrorhamnose 3,5-epimerase-like enzyme
MRAKVQIAELGNRGDARGLSFSAPPEALRFVGGMSDVHLASTKPGAVRGNHYHLLRREALVVMPGAKWSLHWDEGQNCPVQHREFDGASAVLVLISPGASHAVRNDSDREDELWLIAISSEPYDPSDTVLHKLT